MQVNVEEVLIPGPRQDLSAVIHYPADRPAAQVSWLVMSHGFRGSKDGQGRAVRLADAASRLGLGVLRFDFTPCEPLSCQVEELLAVVDYLQARGWGPLVLLGRSMGGCASLLAAAQRRLLVRALCLWAAPADLQVTFRRALGDQAYGRLRQGEEVVLEEEGGRLSLQPAFLAEFDRYDLPGVLCGLGALPLLLVQGDADELVPVAQARSYAEASRGECTLAVIPGGDHRLGGHAAESAAAVLAWLGSL